MKLSHNSQLFATLNALNGYITAPVRETVKRKTADGTRNTVERTIYHRKRVIDYVNSQTVLYLLGYATADAYKIITPYGRDNYSKLLKFLAFVRVNNVALMDAVDVDPEDDADATLVRFTELAIKWYAATYDGIKVERVGKPGTQYMQVVKG